jgi:Concanavalin A-like lectin/glucanases superfamily/Immunoglobulin domain
LEVTTTEQTTAIQRKQLDMKPNHTTIVPFACVLLLVLSAARQVRADYQSTVLSQGPAGYWRLNEIVQPPFNSIATNQGSMLASANGNYIGSPVHQLPGPFAGSVALGLDGVSQYVSTPWVAGLNTTSFSFELWANPALVPKFAYLASSAELGSPRSGWYLAQDNGSTFGVGSAFVVRMFNTNAANPDVSLSAPITTAGIWYHLVLTSDGTTASLYTNGVLAQSAVLTNYPAGSVKYVPNVDAPFTVGIRSSLNFPWPGQVAESAMYSSVLSATRVAAHYTAATTAPGTYASTVLADAPLLYDRYTEPADVSSANIGTLGSAANAKYQFGTTPGVVGPRTIPYPGFAATNTAVAFNASGASVSVPALNFNTNTVTISGWVNASNIQSAGAGLVVCDAGTTYAGLTINAIDGGLELGYVWNNDPNTYNWGTAANLGVPLPTLPDSDWAYVALVVSPSQASIFVASTNIPFSGATNVFNHVNQLFEGATLFGSDGGASALALNGALDEVAIWNRSLGAGELYSQYASAVGGLSPQIFADPQAPSQPVVIGDTLTLTVDAGGTPNLTYFWRENTTTIVLITTNVNVYSKPNFGFGDVGTYDVIVSNAFGFVTSGSALVTGQNATAPVIVSVPISRTLYTGGTLNLSVVATGGGLQFQWKRSNTNLPGATGSSYTVASVTTSNAGTYTLSVTNTLGATNLGPFVITIPAEATNSYEGLVIASGPEAWWRLDETAGSTNLYDGMGRHDGYYTNLNGTVPPVTLGVPGTLTSGNTAASFSASGGVGVIPYSASLNSGKHTYEGWVKTTVLNQFLVPFSSSFAGTGVWWAEIPNGFWTPDSATGSYPISPLVPIAANVWTHLVMTYDSTIVSSGTHYPLGFYINGGNISGGSTWTDNSGLNSGGPIIIGGRGVSAATLAASFFNGQVDEVAVYSRVLTVAEITNHFLAGFPPTPPTFTVQPQSQSVFAGQNANFSATLAGSQPIKVQWKKNGVSLPGQTNNTLTVSNVYYTDTGTIYSVAATNSAGGLLSSNAVLTVYYPSTFAYLTNGLVLHLPFDGNYNDTSGHGNNGTPVGSPAFVPGTIGSQSLQYTTTSVTNGSGNPSNVTVSVSSYVNLGLPADLQFGSAASFSIGLWVKLPAGFAGGDLPFIGTGIGSMNNPGWDLGPSFGAGGWQWCLNDGVLPSIVTNNIDVSGPDNSINDGNWHNFVLTVDRTAHMANSYLDGAPVASRDITGLGSLDNGSSVTIGQDPTGQYPTLSPATQSELNTWGPLQVATLDDLGIWRRALTDLEARSIYYAGQNGKSFDIFGPVVLTINRLANGNIELIWQTGTLKSATSLLGPWTPVSGASAPYYQFTPTSTNTFFGVGP